MQSTLRSRNKTNRLQGTTATPSGLLNERVIKEKYSAVVKTAFVTINGIYVKYLSVDVELRVFTNSDGTG